MSGGLFAWSRAKPDKGNVRMRTVNCKEGLPDLVRLMEAETGPVHHLSHGSSLLMFCLRSGLSQQEDRLVLQLPGDVHSPRHVPPGELEAGDDGGNQSPGVNGLVTLRPPGSSAQLRNSI